MEASFLQAIADDPDDLVTRRVFADWLSEQPGPARSERGEFVQIQFTLAAGPMPADEHRRLAARQKELLERHQEGWEAPFRGLVRSCEYHHGFSERVTLDPEHVVGGLDELVRRTPVVRVRLHGLTPATVGDIAAVPALAHVRELDLQRERVSAPVLEALLRSPHLARLRGLNLARNALDLGDEGVRVLIGSGVFGRLQSLNLSHVGLSAAGVRTLLNAIAAGTAPALRWIALRGAPRRPSGEYPTLPSTLPRPLRQSIEGQTGAASTAPPSLLRQLHATRASLTPDLRQWAEVLHDQGPRHLARALPLLPLPADLHQAFAAVCMRRALWRAERAGSALPSIPAFADTPGAGLAGAVDLLTRLTDPEKEAAALTDILLELFLLHERDELPADGKTR